MKESWGRCGMGGGNKEQTPMSRPWHWGLLLVLPLGDAWGGSLCTEPGYKRGERVLWVLEGVVFVLVCGRSDAFASSLLVHPPWGPQGGEGCLCPERDPSAEARWAGDKGGKKGLFWGGKCPPLDTQLDVKGVLGCRSLAPGNRGCFEGKRGCVCPGDGAEGGQSPSCLRSPPPVSPSCRGMGWGVTAGGPTGLLSSFPEQAGQILQPAAVLQEEGGLAGAQCQAGGLPPAPALVPHRQHPQGGDGGKG